MIGHNEIEYIWKNYAHLIDAHYDVLKVQRAILTKLPFLEGEPNQEKVEKYRDLGSEVLKDKLSTLTDNRREEIAKDIYARYSDEIYLNYCEHCKAIAISPKSERCIKCGYEWYDENPHRRS